MQRQDVSTFKAVEAGMCMHLGLLLSLFWYAQVPRYAQSVFVYLHIKPTFIPKSFHLALGTKCNSYY